MSKFFFLLCFFVFCTAISARIAVDSEEENIISKEKKQILEKEELQVQESFPQYRTRFSYKSLQEEVYKKILKKLKEKEQSE